MASNLCAQFAKPYNRWNKAQQIYLLGIQNKAEPLSRLKQIYAAFLSRAPPPSQRPVVPKRVLGKTILSAASQSGAGTISNPINATSSKIAVLRTDDLGTSQQEEWELQGRDDRRKEDTQTRTPWKGETIRQDHMTPSRFNTTQIEPFCIFRDDDQDIPQVRQRQPAKQS